MTIRPRAFFAAALLAVLIGCPSPSTTGKTKSSPKPKGTPDASASASPGATTASTSPSPLASGASPKPSASPAASPKPSAAPATLKPSAAASTAASPATGTSPTPTPSPSPTPTASAAAANLVTIQDMAFTPAEITVKIGDSVTFTNLDTLAHTASPGDDVDPAHTGNFSDTGTIISGGSRKVTFTSVGDQYYHCKFHPTMTGKVIVTP